MMRNLSRIMLLALTLQCVPTFAIEIDNLEANDRQVDDFADDVFGDGFFPGYLCDECRDPATYPTDFAAFAYNGFFGETPWLRDTELGIPFRVYALDREWVVIWFDNVLFDIQTMLPNLLDILIRLETGEIVKITVVQNGPDMPIGDPDADSGDVTACSCGDGDSGGDEDEYDDPNDYDDWNDYEPDVPEGIGVVEIEDPDENGEFFDWEQEL